MGAADIKILHILSNEEGPCIIHTRGRAGFVPANCSRIIEEGLFMEVFVALPSGRLW